MSDKQIAGVVMRDGGDIVCSLDETAVRFLLRHGHQPELNAAIWQLTARLNAIEEEHARERTMTHE